MRRLFHHTLSAGSRAVRFLLSEQGLDVELVPEKPWERRRDFLALNPAGEVPVLIDQRSTPREAGQQKISLDEDAPAEHFEGMEAKGPPEPVTIVGARAIIEYVDETYDGTHLLGETAAARAECRRLIDWFDVKFNAEVSELIVGEKVIKRLSKMGMPDTEALRIGLANIGYHLDYVGWLAERRRWIAGEEFSAADMMAAAHISAIDYIGDVPWEKHAGARDWYMRVKSRKSFRPILADHISGLPPPRHYANPDF